MLAGIMVRANQRGLGTQSYEAWRHLSWAGTLLVLDGDRAWPEDQSLYPGAVSVRWVPGQGLYSAIARDWVEQMDVVFSIETVYDRSLPSWGTPTLVQGNPEFYRRENYTVEPRFTWPTPWQLDRLPAGPVVPVPVPDDKVRPPVEPAERLRILHPIGRAAAGDRNGTLLFVEALRSLQSQVDVRIVTQDLSLPHPLPGMPRNVNVDVTVGGMPDRWSMYDDIDLVVIPRRYGGLCLPTQEAMARGCAVMMTECPPNDCWPTVRIPHARGRLQHTPLARIETFSAHPRMIARMIDRLARDPARLALHKEEGHQWAASHTWSVLHRVYTDLLERVAGGRP